MEKQPKEKQPLGDLLAGAMEKIRGIVDSNTVVGQPIETPDGVTLIPVSRVSFGVAAGGSDGGANGGKTGVWAGSGAGVKVDPLGFLIVSGGSVRMVGIQTPAVSTADRIIDMVPEVLDRVEGYVGAFNENRKSKKAARAEAEAAAPAELTPAQRVTVTIDPAAQAGGDAQSDEARAGGEA